MSGQPASYLPRSAARRSEPSRTACIGVNFIRSAFCPLTFRRRRLADHPKFTEAIRHDEGLAPLGNLEVGESLVYATLFPYYDGNKHRRIATQTVAAPFGLAPTDFKLLTGLYTYLRSQEGSLQDREIEVTIDFLGKISGLPTGGGANYRRIRSQLFRLSHVTYTNPVFWNTKIKEYEDVSQAKLFTITRMARLTRPRERVSIRFSEEFLRMVRHGPSMAFNPEPLKSGGLALERLCLIASQQAWCVRDSLWYVADEFCVYQLGYARHACRKQDRNQRKTRLHTLKGLLREAEDRDFIRPHRRRAQYLTRMTSGPLAGELRLQWSRGPALKTKATAAPSDLSLDVLYDQVQDLVDQHGRPMEDKVYRYLLKQHGREKMQKQLRFHVAQKTLQPGSFRSEVAAFIDRLNHDHGPPACYDDYVRQQQTASTSICSPEARDFANTILQS